MCGTVGALVNSKTVEKLLKVDLKKDILKYEIMSLCMGKECEMAYFSADYGYLYFQDILKVPLDFKADAEYRYVCYCNKITIEQLKYLVLIEGARTIKDVFRFKNPIIIEDCRSSNPFGYCCVPDVKKMIDDILSGIEV